jgi:hypothetical protein
MGSGTHQWNCWFPLSSFIPPIHTPPHSSTYFFAGCLLCSIPQYSLNFWKPGWERAVGKVLTTMNSTPASFPGALHGEMPHPFNSTLFQRERKENPPWEPHTWWEEALWLWKRETLGAASETCASPRQDCTLCLVHYSSRGDTWWPCQRKTVMSESYCLVESEVLGTGCEEKIVYHPKHPWEPSV